MVVLDLLDSDSTAAASKNAYSSGSKASSGAVSGCRRGDVVLAKYGNTSRFFWARVKKVYKSNTGDSLCDVEWVRPQAGAPVGKLYALHANVDETCHGDGIQLFKNVRRPCADDLRGGAPPGAVAATSPGAVAATSTAADLLGEPIVEKKKTDLLGELSQGTSLSTPSAMDSLFQAKPPPPPTVSMADPMCNPTNGGVTANGAPTWQANFGATPWIGASGLQAFPSVYSVAPHAATRFGGFQQKPPPQSWPEKSVSSVVSTPSLNDLQASLVSGSLIPSGRRDQPLNVSVTKNEFDFVADIMSGALTDAK